MMRRDQLNDRFMAAADVAAKADPASVEDVAHDAKPAKKARVSFLDEFVRNINLYINQVFLKK
eukprot:c9021_g1_i1 orf=99-287(+)